MIGETIKKDIKSKANKNNSDQFQAFFLDAFFYSSFKYLSRSE